MRVPDSEIASPPSVADGRHYARRARARGRRCLEYPQGSPVTHGRSRLERRVVRLPRRRFRIILSLLLTPRSLRLTLRAFLNIEDSRPHISRVRQRGERRRLNDEAPCSSVRPP